MGQTGQPDHHRPAPLAFHAPCEHTFHCPANEHISVDNLAERLQGGPLVGPAAGNENDRERRPPGKARLRLAGGFAECRIERVCCRHPHAALRRSSMRLGRL